MVLEEEVPRHPVPLVDLVTGVCVLRGGEHEEVGVAGDVCEQGEEGLADALAHDLPEALEVGQVEDGGDGALGLVDDVEEGLLGGPDRVGVDCGDVQLVTGELLQAVKKGGADVGGEALVGGSADEESRPEGERAAGCGL